MADPQELPRTIDIPEDAVLFVVALAGETGTHVDISVNLEWWHTTELEHRKALFMGLLKALQEVAMSFIPEDFVNRTDN